jgi:hypothetical protein
MGNAGGAMGGRTRSNRFGRRDGRGTIDGTMSLNRQTKELFLTSDLCFFLLKSKPPASDFRYSFGFFSVPLSTRHGYDRIKEWLVPY